MQEKSKKNDIHIIANAALGPYMSGGDRIFIEYARYWVSRNNNVTVYVWEEGFDLCKRNGLDRVKYVIWSAKKYKKYGFAVNYFMRTLIGIKASLKITPSAIPENAVVYSSSDFWPDALPAFIMRKRVRNCKWVAGFYLFAPKPWQKDSPYKGKSWFIGLFYWIMQLPVYWMVNKYADTVFVTSDPDVGKFVTKNRSKNKIIVIRGGVDIKPSQAYLNSGEIIPVNKRKYDACFVGRFHHQKGIFELIDIWGAVCKISPEAKLAMIGGPLNKDITKRINQHKLINNIDFLGFRDGNEKYEIFKQSKVIVHPATYDSGGMAACEAMAWGLPGVSFDLDALKTYYPKGMLKTPCYDINKFAENILRLTKDEALYKKTSKDALEWAKEWDWDRRAENVLQQLSA